MWINLDWIELSSDEWYFSHISVLRLLKLLRKQVVENLNLHFTERYTTRYAVFEIGDISRISESYYLIQRF